MAKRLRLNERALKVYMAERGINTKEELARASGISTFTLRRIIGGEDFRLSTLESIADALKCNPLDLLEPEGYPSPHVEAPVAI